MFTTRFLFAVFRSGADDKSLCYMQGREGKVVQVYRKKWVIHIERITREKVNGACQTALRVGGANFAWC